MKVHGSHGAELDGSKFLMKIIAKSFGIPGAKLLNSEGLVGATSAPFSSCNDERFSTPVDP